MRVIRVAVFDSFKNFVARKKSNRFGFKWAHVSLRMDRYATRAEELAARLVPEEFLGESQDGWRFADLILLYLNLNDCWKGNPEFEFQKWYIQPDITPKV